MAAGADELSHSQSGCVDYPWLVGDARVRHTELDVVRERLQQRLDGLTKRAGKIETDLRQPLNPDSEARVTERENDEVLQSL